MDAEPKSTLAQYTRTPIADNGTIQERDILKTEIGEWKKKWEKNCNMGIESEH